VFFSRCSFLAHYEQYSEFDAFVSPVPEPGSPWISDNTEYWEVESTMKDIPPHRIKRWGFSIHELLRDPAGREHFRRFLEKEFSAENLKYAA
jgi:regulator of G-protein signaling